MSNTIEDLIRDIIHYETEEAREDMKQDIIEDINIALPDYDIVDAFQKLEKRINELEVPYPNKLFDKTKELEERIKVLEERLEEAND